MTCSSFAVYTGVVMTGGMVITYLFTGDGLGVILPVVIAWWLLCSWRYLAWMGRKRD